jgi:hypothetical protein
MADARSAVTLDLQGFHDLLRVLREMGSPCSDPPSALAQLCPGA